MCNLKCKLGIKRQEIKCTGEGDKGSGIAVVTQERERKTTRSLFHSSKTRNNNATLRIHPECQEVLSRSPPCQGAAGELGKMEERLEAGPERERERENEKKRQAAALEREPAKFSSSLLAAQFFRCSDKSPFKSN